MDDEIADRLAIRDVVETWANARDSRDWEAMPGLTGPEVERLSQRGSAWLAGEPVAP